MHKVQIMRRITESPATVGLAGPWADVAKGTRIRPLEPISVAVAGALTDPAELERAPDDRP